MAIPLSRNHAGYPHGIAGHELLRRMRCQTKMCGRSIHTATVTAIERDHYDFTVLDDGRYRESAVLLATG